MDVFRLVKIQKVYDYYTASFYGYTEVVKIGGEIVQTEVKTPSAISGAVKW